MEWINKFQLKNSFLAPVCFSKCIINSQERSLEAYLETDIWFHQQFVSDCCLIYWLENLKYFANIILKGHKQDNLIQE